MLLTQELVTIMPGVQLVYSDRTEAEVPRFWLNSGTTQQVKPLFDDIRYRADAFIPKDRWREPSSTEYHTLFTHSLESNLNSWDAGSCIGIIRVPDPVLAPLEAILEKIRTSFAATPEDCSLVDIHPERENALESVRKYIQRYCISPNGFETIGLQTTIPGLATVASSYREDIATKLYDGLHLDNLDRYPLRRRHKSRNRMSINLGCEDRYFLFINLTLMDMFHALGLSDPEDIYKHYRGISLGSEFMKKFPSYPVVKIRVKPREAYIAPTDNMIHDGSTSGKKYSDVSLTFVGNFGIEDNSNGYTN